MRTPGPWKVIESASGKPLIVADHPRSLGDVAKCQDTPAGWADAHLIAAAPELLAALDVLTACLENRIELLGHDPADDARVKLARAAIAKALEGSK